MSRFISEVDLEKIRKKQTENYRNKQLLLNSSCTMSKVIRILLVLLLFVYCSSCWSHPKYFYEKGPVKKNSSAKTNCPGVYCGRHSLNETFW